MAVRELPNNDESYLAWLADHSDGCVINVLPSKSSNGARLHHAHCWTINSRPARGGMWTHPYEGVCGSRCRD